MKNERKWREELRRWIKGEGFAFFREGSIGLAPVERAYFYACQERQKEIDRLKQALKDIIDPIGRIKRLMKPGDILEGSIAIQLSHNPNYLTGIAKDALKDD